jgi:hypothetical protein
LLLLLLLPLLLLGLALQQLPEGLEGAAAVCREEGEGGRAGAVALIRKVCKQDGLMPSSGSSHVNIATDTIIKPPP